MKPEHLLMMSIFIAGIMVVGVFIYQMYYPPTPQTRFNHDKTLIESCYINITNIETQNIERNMQVRAEKVYVYHKECVDRNLDITYIGNDLKMETKQFGSYALQSGTYIKYSGNGTGGLKYGDLL